MNKRLNFTLSLFLSTMLLFNAAMADTIEGGIVPADTGTSSGSTSSGSYSVVPTSMGSIDTGISTASSLASGSTIDATSQNVLIDSDTSGQADLPTSVTQVQLSSSTNINLTEATYTASSSDTTIQVAGVSKTISSYTNNDLAAQSLSSVSVGDQTVSVKKAVQLESGTNGTAITLSTEATNLITVSIPDGAAILAPSAWDNKIVATTGRTSGTVPAGYTLGGTSIEVGSSSQTLLLDKPATIILNDVQSYVGYLPGGSSTWVRITGTCAGTYASPTSPAFPGECYISDSTANKTKILTWHLTTFSNLAPETVASASSSVGGGGGGGGGDFTVDTDTPYKLSEIESDEKTNLVRPLDLSKTGGVITRPLGIKNINRNFSIDLRKGTIITYEDGSVFTGTILVPDTIAQAERPAVDAGYQYVRIIKLGSKDSKSLKFSKPYTLQVPVSLSRDVDPERVKIYRYLEDSKSYEKIGGNLSTDQKIFTAEIDHMSTYAVLYTSLKSDEQGYGTDSDVIIEAQSEKDSGASESENTEETEEIEETDLKGITVEYFKDLKNHWSTEYVTNLYEIGVFKKGDQFYPNRNTTRAEFVKILLIAFNINVEESVSYIELKDVNVKEWYAPYVKAALKEGIIKGYPDGTFRPSDQLNRAEALTMILRAAGVKDMVFKATFDDVPESAWFSKYVSFAVEKGIVKGRSQNSFAPSDPITRAEVSKVMSLTLEVID